MKKKHYLLLPLLMAFLCLGRNAKAQTITIDSMMNFSDSSCLGVTFYLQTSAYVSGLNVKSYFGDGTMITTTITSSGYAFFGHSYTAPGTYTVKHVLCIGTARIDSSIKSREYLYCETFCGKIYQDLNSNCVYDSATESFVNQPFVIEVSKGGVPIDTVTATSGIYYKMIGSVGDIFRYRILSSPAGVNVTCPSSGILYDTLHYYVNDHVVKYFGVACTGTSAVNASVYGTTRTGRHSYISEVIVGNAYCTPQNVTLTMHKSAKYGTINNIIPTPTSIVGNTITWNFTGVSLMNPVHVTVHYEQTPWNIVGDTVHTNFAITHIAGDTVTSNDSINVVDTVTGSFDPNDKAVSPQGWLVPGPSTKLTYTVRFENTGNDTAFNVHIMDTLSSNLDVKSLNIVASSAIMNLAVLQNGTQNIVKFDFPDINLLDSSHHGLCDGMVIFTINTKPGLAFGTAVDNRAGIYFDFNDVVMTNTVRNVVGIPTGTGTMSNKAPLNVYPNPANDELTVDVAGDYTSLSIADAVGRVVITQKIGAGPNKVKVGALSPGIYLLTLRGEDGVQTQKFQKL